MAIMKNTRNKKVGDDVEKDKFLCTVNINANWYSHCGEQFGGSLKNYD